MGNTDEQVVELLTDIRVAIEAEADNTRNLIAYLLAAVAIGVVVISALLGAIYFEMT